MFINKTVNEGARSHLGTVGKDREYRVVSALPLCAGKVCAQSSEKDSLTVSLGENSGVFVCWLPSVSFGHDPSSRWMRTHGNVRVAAVKDEMERGNKKVEDKKYVEYPFCN